MRSARGSLSLELAIIAPALLLFVGLVVAAGRVSLAGQSVQTAAAQAARDSSLQRTPAAGVAAARDTARRVLAEQKVDCTTTAIDVDAADLALAVGRAGTVTVSVSCQVRLSDVGLPGMPGSKTLTSTSAMPIDAWIAKS